LALALPLLRQTTLWDLDITSTGRFSSSGLAIRQLWPALQLFFCKNALWQFVSLVSKMPARLKPILVRTHRQLQQQSKRLDDWQKFIDEQTAKEFERYAARLKRIHSRRVLNS
jgi:hypothetical protein